MDIRQTYQDFFTQYGQPSEEANKELRIWLRRPDALDKIEDVTKQANFVRDDILPKMAAVRVAADEAETLTDSKYWPFPTYGDLLFKI